MEFWEESILLTVGRPASYDAALTEIAGSLKHSCAGQRRKRVNLRDYAGQVGIVLQ